MNHAGERSCQFSVRKQSRCSPTLHRFFESLGFLRLIDLCSSVSICLHSLGTLHLHLIMFGTSNLSPMSVFRWWSYLAGLSKYCTKLIYTTFDLSGFFLILESHYNISKASSLWCNAFLFLWLIKVICRHFLFYHLLCSVIVISFPYSFCGKTEGILRLEFWYFTIILSIVFVYYC